MSDELATVATFGDLTQAQLARNALEAAGIQAALTEQETSSLFGPANAGLAGIHLLVRESDVEAAGRILDEAFDPTLMDDEDVAREAEAAGTQEEPAPESPPYSLDDREKDAGKAFATAMLGLLFHPLWIYTGFLFFRALSGPGRLSGRGKVYLTIAGLVLAAWAAGIIYLFALIDYLLALR